ncbi:DUF6089 family protein [Wenyingzhuangia sp. IMCC45533]
MRKLVYILLIMFSSIGFSQVYEAGVSYNLGQIVGENNSSFSLVAPNLGFVIKKNMNPRIAYRIAANYINTNTSDYTEVSAGIDFSFTEYNLVRPGKFRKGAPYVIFEIAGLFYDNNENNDFALALPLGIGYKKAISKNLVGSIEAKGRIALTDQLDNPHDRELPNYVNRNNTTLDAYYYLGLSLYYTFGWPRGSKNQTRF